ncbi:pyruvate kinase [Candidatus Bathyarchaeota archaeon]|nr:pyruvate kinase [Candidatus Bathyarchaeota archaeon]
MKHNMIPTRSKIVCTIGPACESKEKILAMAKAGMDVLRLNLSHGTIADHQARFERIRKHLPNHPILMDLEGPRVRIGQVKEAFNLDEGDHITLTTEDIEGDATRVSVSLKTLPKLIEAGQSIFINDGIVELRVDRIKGSEIHSSVLTGGEISANKGVNVPGVNLGMAVPTAQDIEHLKFISKLSPEFVAISAVKQRSEVEKVQEFLRNEGTDIPIISKIEHIKAIENFDEILDVSYGIMVARGDLGVEIPPEQVPLLQKEIIHKCNQAGKPVIVATQMLESMVRNSRPTRAETSDVANAILDGSDAVMLSAETAVGRHPVAAVKAMETIGRQVIPSFPQRDLTYYDSGQHLIAEELGRSVVSIVRNLDVQTVLVFTMAGYTARMVSKYRPFVRIIASTPHLRVQRQLKLLWGTESLLIPHCDNMDELLQLAIKHLHTDGIVKPKERIVVVRASALVPGKTNVLEVFTVKDVLEAKVL